MMKTASKLLAGLSLLACLSSTAPAIAKNFMVGDPPAAVISLPDKWKLREYDGGVEANAPDGGVYVAVEVVALKDIATATAAGIKYFEEHKVTIDQSTMQKRTTKIGGLDAVDVMWKARDSDGPTNVGLTFVIVSETQSVLLYLWGTDDDIKDSAAELKAIADSLKPVAR